MLWLVYLAIPFASLSIMCDMAVTSAVKTSTLMHKFVTLQTLDKDSNDVCIFI